MTGPIPSATLLTNHIQEKGKQTQIYLPRFPAVQEFYFIYFEFSFASCNLFPLF